MGTAAAFGNFTKKNCDHVIMTWTNDGRFKYPEWRQLSWIGKGKLPMFYDTIFNFCPCCGKDLRKLVKN